MAAILIWFRAEGWDRLEDFLKLSAQLDVDKSELAVAEIPKPERLPPAKTGMGAN